MASITPEYVDSLDSIYRDILAVFPKIDPARRAGYGLAYQTIYEGLREKYSFAKVMAACGQMSKGGAVTIKNGLYVHPTEFGEEIIAALTGDAAETGENVPPFPSPPK